MSSDISKLIAKYDVPVPRYTSYPTVPYWAEAPTHEQWIGHLRETLQNSKNRWSMYMHLPFCESLCTFCGCNTTITKDHKKEEPYINSVIQEWNLYKAQVPELMERPLTHLHLGGGTPTFFSPAALKTLIETIWKDVKKDTEHFEASIEVDPRRTSVEHLKVLKELGFDRVSMGVQDFNPEVQRLVNRIQPYDITAKLTEEARAIGFRSVNYDLIYGLAKQTPESFAETARLTVALRPDRIALYSFALVPWIKPAQRLFKDEDLPSGAEKRKLYEIAREILMKAGYVEIGMDHFALPTEALSHAAQTKKLHRNFMGYTDQRSEVLLGLGVSSISETPYSFHQNEKLLNLYQERVEKGEIPTHRGHVHTNEDRERRQQILSLMTQLKVSLNSQAQAQAAKTFLEEMAKDGLVTVTDSEVTVTEKGRPFLRNACVFFDERLRSKQPQTQVFSKSI
ncbi:oxygen-independent coproporphyrinogen III oxidase [Bdellovibrio sp. HCB337]|uniref:oxygen-independent coproporphyrinogen III oxidase n=1 Tax=Bdellovibrio sp. HCB337 TaxID=3394358 RepID=UPI0039A61CCE